MNRERPYVPSEDFGTIDDDNFKLDWLEEARTNSDLYLLSGWARMRIETLRAERDQLLVANAVAMFFELARMDVMISRAADTATQILLRSSQRLVDSDERADRRQRERDEARADYTFVAEALGCIHHHPHGGHCSPGTRDDLLSAIRDLEAQVRNARDRADEAGTEQTALAIDGARVAVARDKAIARAEAAELALAEVDMVLGVVGADRDFRRQMLCSNRDRLRQAERARDEARDCGQDGVCVISPGCQRHWEERVREVIAERDARPPITPEDAEHFDKRDEIPALEKIEERFGGV